MDHFTYCVELIGVEHVTFRPDTLYGDHVALHREPANGPGATPLPLTAEYEPVEYVAGLENPTENFVNIVGWPVEHGYSDADIVAVTGGNVMRVLERTWGPVKAA